MMPSKSLNMLQDLNSTSKFELVYRHYNALFTFAHDELSNLLQKDFSYEEPTIVEDRVKAISLVSNLYLKYIQLTNTFIECYENIANPQKRLHLRQMCDGCIGRALELKHELVSLEMSDFPVLDRTLLELKLSFQHMDIRIPEYFNEILSGEEKERKDVLADLLKTAKEEEAQKNAVTKEEKSLRLATVLLRMIQGHFRTRQAGKQFWDLQKQFLNKELTIKKQSMSTKAFNTSRNEAAIVIQNTWRKYNSQKVLNCKLFKEKELLKMIPPKFNTIPDEIETDRKRIIKRNEEEYIKEKVNLKEDILLYKAPRMAEKIEAVIREYFQKYNELNGKYPEFPTEEEGGSLTMLAIPPEQDLESIEEPDLSSEQETKAQKTTKQAEKKLTKGGKNSTEEEEPIGYTIKPSKYVAIFEELIQSYHRNWAGREIIDFDKFSVELMTLEVEKEVEFMVRIQVDEKMRKELMRLSEAFQKDSKIKAKKSKQTKGKKKKREKEEQDITSDRSFKSLVEELISQGIIIDFSKCKLKDFTGENNYSGSVRALLDTDDNEPLPCLADIRRVVNEYCILPMGSQAVHSGGANVKSILFVGPHGSGKTLIVQAICTEIGATMINLSADNIEGKYPGEEGMEMLMHLISKVSRLLQPTIVYIKNVEDYFWKKKCPKSGISEPGVWKKELAKFIRKLKDTERVQVCGTTALPFNTDTKGLNRCFSKIICIFKPDYNCRRYLWKEFIVRSEGDIDNCNLNVLSSVSDGFVASHIKHAVARTLNARRLAFQKKMPLSALDFMLSLAENVPVYEEEHEEYKLWLKKLPLGQKRTAFYEALKDEKEETEEEEVSGDDY